MVEPSTLSTYRTLAPTLLRSESGIERPVDVVGFAVVRAESEWQVPQAVGAAEAVEGQDPVATSWTGGRTV